MLMRQEEADERFEEPENQSDKEGGESDTTKGKLRPLKQCVQRKIFDNECLDLDATNNRCNDKRESVAGRAAILGRRANTADDGHPAARWWLPADTPISWKFGNP